MSTNLTYFTYWQSKKDNQWYFNYKAGNNEKMLRSEGYTTESACVNGIDVVKRISPNDSSYRRMRDVNNQWFYNMVANNNEKIATSESYASEAMMVHSISIVKAYAGTAPTKRLEPQYA